MATSKSTNDSSFPEPEEIIQLSGDGLWHFLESALRHLHIPPMLKKTLQFMGYDNARGLQTFDLEKDVTEIENFMRTVLPTVMERKHKGDKDAYQKEMELYYGLVFAYSPENYKILGGFKMTLRNISSTLKGLLHSLNPHLKSSCSSQAPSEVPATATNEELVQAKRKLLAGINKYLGKRFSHLVADNSNEGIQSVDADVFRSTGNILAAKITCPVINCVQKVTILKIKYSWNPTNFYRHLERCHSSKKTTFKADQSRIVSMFKSKGKCKKKEQACLDQAENIDECSTGSTPNSNVSVEKVDSAQHQNLEEEYGSPVPSKKKRLNTPITLTSSDSEDADKNENFHYVGEEVQK